MARKSPWTLEEVRIILGKAKEAYISILGGTAKSYKIGSREYTALDLPELEKLIEKYGALENELTGQTRTNRVVRIVPRDL